MKLVTDLFPGKSSAAGMWLTLGSPALAEIMTGIGYDWVVIDLEHGPSTNTMLIEQVRAVESANHRSGNNTLPMARLGSHEPPEIKAAMDAGCRALIFPDVRDARAAEVAVRSMKYPMPGQIGHRGVAGIVRAGFYGLDRGYVAAANDNACAILQIESAEGVENIAEIVKVPEVGCIFLGPTDLAASMGHIGDNHHPEVLAAMERVLTVCREAGIPVGAFALTAEEAADFHSKGVFFISMHSDVFWMTSSARAARDSLTFLD